MRAIFIAALMALGIGLVGTSPISAAPARGGPIADAAHVNQSVDKAHWYWRRHHRHHRHCWVGRFGRVHCGWW